MVASCEMMDACESKISGRVNNKKRGPWEENHGRVRPVILPARKQFCVQGSIRKMRVPRAFLFLALVASLTSTAYAAGAPPPVDFPVARNFHNFVPGRLGSFFSSDRRAVRARSGHPVTRGARALHLS